MTTTNTIKDPQIARNIMTQLGNGTLAMLGAFDLLDLGNGLQFRIRGSRKANYVQIELDIGTDLYNVKIYKIGRAPGYKITVVADTQGVFVDRLHTLIEEATGLLARM